ncbi:SAM-dependent methyltransferase [Candidatus Scalindua japonica]|uniref:SAM-dependent methyltransferase n=1 Tax=Candidatus Scalindua japonica TaxID=1284222 RepID=A0A286U1D9_9BACT|nr:class I SAM-dependent methyltransferase [Candidatus Scalindua japonica]GAX61954.1 SAM-dependent methyltransferase [Candidatus Scalindua japonica]
MPENNQRETAYAFNSSDIIATYDLDMDVWHPNRKHMASIACEVLPFDRYKKIQILDLGVGTGYLTHKIIEMFPHASVVAIDAAGMMIDKAKIRLKAQLGQITFKTSTFQELSEKTKNIIGLDAVVSAFALHHLLRDEKLKLFKYVHSILKPDGWFINCDIFNAVNPANEALYRRLLYKGTQERSRSMKNEEKTLEYIESEYTTKEKRDGDNPLSITEETQLLIKAGFSMVDCFWKEYREAIYGGKK